MVVHRLPNLAERICKALLETIWAHDPATAKHCQRVGRMSEEFLTYLNCTPEQVYQGSLGGMIHDLGKVGVPIDLLHKAEMLTKAERKRIEGHALWGKQIVRSLRGTPGLDEILDVVEYHHEQWTGKGYPNHMSAESIPFLARAVSIVDAFDAMTSQRSYGTPKSVPAAILEIQNAAGTQFDPVLATKFVEWMRRVRIPAPKRTAA
jgi:HD-GYP domain-containing protein (c-di-GMP phosphodiesterase class II)